MIRSTIVRETLDETLISVELLAGKSISSVAEGTVRRLDPGEATQASPAEAQLWRAHVEDDSPRCHVGTRRYRANGAFGGLSAFAFLHAVPPSA